MSLGGLVWAYLIPQPLSLTDPYPFIENKGQLSGSDGRLLTDALYTFSTPGMKGYITRWGLSFYFYREVKADEARSTSSPAKVGSCQAPSLAYERVDMELVGASIRPEQIQAGHRSPWGRNYYLAHCKEGVLDVRGYGEIVIYAVWPGVDWVLRYQPSGLKQEFVVQAGADLSQVRMRWWGLHLPEVSAHQMRLSTEYGVIHEEKLLAYHGIVPTKMTYQVLGTSTKAGGIQSVDIGFSVEGVQGRPVNTLVLDPVLEWGTYFGGNQADSPTEITTAPNGDLLLAGRTVVAPDFPLQDPGNGAYFDNTHTGQTFDGFVARFNGSNLSLLWSTYFGGVGSEPFISITTDLSGNVFIAGWTEANVGFPLLNPGGGAYFDGIFDGGREGFIAKFSGSNLALVWSTYFGGIDDDRIYSIATDPAGNVLITGSALVVNPFPFQDPGGGAYFSNAAAGSSDGFVAKFSASNLALVWCTLFGGNGYDECFSITTDANGDIFIGGVTGSNAGFPLQNPGGGAYYNSNPDPNNVHAFIAKFGGSNLALLWSTYFGGDGQDVIRCVDVAPNGDVFAYGFTNSNTNFPLQDPGNGAYFDDTFNGSDDAFISKFSGTNLQLVWSTYYGGQGLEELRIGRSLYAGNGFIGMVLGVSSASANTFPVGVAQACSGGFYQQSLYGSFETAILVFTDQGQPLWRTYFGGFGIEYANAITFYNNYAYVAGTSVGTLLNSQLVNPGGGAYFDNTFNGPEDCFLLRLDMTGCIPVINSVPMTPEVSMNTKSPKWRAYWRGDVFVIESLSHPNPFVLMDIYGRALRQWDVPMEGLQVHLPLPQGIYLLQDKKTGYTQSIMRDP